MVNLRKPDLGILGLTLNSSTILYDDTQALSGNHLRWNFNPEMGFPKDGFTIQRYPYSILNRQNNEPWKLIETVNRPQMEWEKKINLPLSKNEALSRISEVILSSSGLDRFNQPARDLLEVVDFMRNTTNPEEPYNTFLDTEEENGLKSGLRVIDVLTTASVDPYIARMLGLYIVDSDADLTKKYVYLIQGHWGDMAFAPIHLSFENYDIPQGVVPLQLGGVKVFPDLRTVGVLRSDRSDFHDAHILVVGNADPGFLLQFEYPVEEVVIKYELNHLSGDWEITALGEALIHNVDSEFLRITRPGSPFQEINFKRIPGITFRIFKISYRRRNGPIGNITNICVIDPVSTRKLSRPTITKLENEQMPAILNETGEIVNKISQIKISSLVTVPKINEVLIPNESHVLKAFEQLDQLNNPVRIQFRKLASLNVRNVLQHHLKNIGPPAIYRENTSNLILPGLLGYWPMNGHQRNLKDGLEPKKIGNPQLVKSDNEDKTSPYILKLKNNDALILENQEHVKVLGDNFTLEATIRINHLCPATATFIGNNRRNGFWWGLSKGADGHFRMRLWINNIAIEGRIPLQIDSLIRLSVSYDGNQVHFRYGGLGFLNFDEPIEAELGKVKIPNQNVTIGADVAANSNALSSSFVGDISEISIWQQVIHPSESKHQLAKAAIFLPQQQDMSQLVFQDQKTYLLHEGEEQVLIQKTHPLKALSTKFSIFLWTRPEISMDEEFPTLLGNSYRNGFWLGLAKSANQYHLRFWLNNILFQSRTKIRENQWSHLGVSYDGNIIKMFVNGRLDTSHPASSVSPLNNDLAIALGSEISSSGATTVQFPFNGFITDIQIWREAMTIQQWQQKMGGVQLIDKFLKNKMHYYGARAIDLFGRTSQYSSIKRIKTNATPKYNPPVNLHAKFKPIMGEIVSLSPYLDRNGKKVGYVIITDIPFRRNLSRSLEGYDLTIKRMISYEVPKENLQDPPIPPIIMETVNRFAEQSFEIEKAIKAGATSFFKFNVKAVPFEQLKPQTGDFVSIQFDFFYELTWGWTGIQQLYFKEVQKFDLFQAVGVQNEISNRIELLDRTPTGDFGPKEYKVKIANNDLGFVANEFNEQYSLIGPNKFRILNHTAGRDPEFKIKYTSEPLVEPKDGDVLQITVPEGSHAYKNLEQNIGPRIDSIPLPNLEPLIVALRNDPTVEVMETVSEFDLENSTLPPIAERKKLIKEKGIDWFPLSKIYKISISDFEQPNGYIQPAPKDYLPGALVFYDKSEQQNKWRSFYVLWHQWTTGTQLVLYTTPGEKNEELPSVVASTANPLRIYMGQRFNYDGELNNLPEFINGQTTEQFHLTLTSTDAEGIKSDLSRSTVMIAVNRKKPLPGPKPEVSIPDKADYYGKCKAYVDWSMHPPPPEPLFYKVFRATDSDIYTRDLEQRRILQGFYKGMDQRQVFLDDVDFNDWLASQDPSSSLNLFPEVDSSEWSDVTPIWRKWADRFYPSLTNEEVNALAERMGNEKAFKLLTGKPIRETSYIDEINGVVNNRYYYRLKTLNEALSESISWGKISLPVITEVVKGPRKPVFTRVEAGDRKVTLHWSLNREPNFKEYILYRSENKEDLEDLRWWTSNPDPRIVAKIPDPRILTKNNSIEIPAEFEIARILRVYRLDEFDKEANPIVNQPQALNYYTASSEFEISTDDSIAHRISRLRKIADGVAIALVYEDAQGDIQHLVQQHELIPFTDTGLVGLRDYYYRLVGENEDNLTSEGSLMQKARPLEILPPAIPRIYLSRLSISASIDEVILNISEMHEPLEIYVKQFDDSKGAWLSIIKWQLIDSTEIKIDELTVSMTKLFSIQFRTLNKTYYPELIYLNSKPVHI